MKLLIETMVRKLLLKEGIETVEVNDIENDDFYDKVLQDVSKLTKDGNISFGSHEPFGVLLDGDKVIGATWAKTDGQFSFHMVVDPNYQRQGLSKKLFDQAFNKYQSLKSSRGEDYKLNLNVVNPVLVSFLEREYGLHVINKDGESFTMSDK